jgi:putative DNA primase/helicase
MIETEKNPGCDTGAKNNHHAKFNGSKHSSQDYIEQFREPTASAGFILNEIIGDGKVHRDPVDGAVAYCLHLDGAPNGWAHNWRTGETFKWKANGQRLNHEERERADAEIKAAKAERDADKAERHARATAETERRWNDAKPAREDHPYLVLKGIKPHGGRELNGELLIPVMRDGKRIGLQFIFWDANSGKWVKRFLKGAQTQGGSSIVGPIENANTIAIAEGFATAATFYEATGIPCVVAFYAGNLLPVAQALKAAFPTGVEFIIAADDDHMRPGNPGLTKASEAAQAIGARLANPGPAFGEHRGEKDTDFNDLARLHGPEAVRGCIEAAEFVAGTADSSATEAKPEDAFRPVQLGNLLRKPAPPRRWTVENWIPAGQVTLLAGDGGIGKSTLVLQLLAACATGTQWLGMDVKQGRVAVLSAEDDIDEMHWRFQCINRGIEGDSEEKLEALNNAWLIDASKDLDPTLANFEEKNSALKLTDTFEKLKAFVAENAIDVLILDSAADVFQRRNQSLRRPKLYPPHPWSC